MTRAWLVLVALHVGRCDDDGIDGDSDATQMAVDTSCEATHILGVFDDQEVDVAVGTHFAASGGPEENDLVGLGNGDDSLNDVVQRPMIERSAIHGAFASPQGKAAGDATRRNCARQSKLN